MTHQLKTLNTISIKIPNLMRKPIDNKIDNFPFKRPTGSIRKKSITFFAGICPRPPPKATAQFSVLFNKMGCGYVVVFGLNSLFATILVYLPQQYILVLFYHLGWPTS
jgi:hypothetical protein